MQNDCKLPGIPITFSKFSKIEMRLPYQLRITMLQVYRQMIKLYARDCKICL